MSRRRPLGEATVPAPVASGPICPSGPHPRPKPDVEPATAHDDDQAPELPRQLRRSLFAIAGLAAAGLLIFLAGFVFGALEEVPTPSVIAAVVVVVVVVVAAIAWMVRMRKP